MIDGSHLPFEENVAVTARVVERAHDAGVWVEAELGALAGDEDASGRPRPGAMTDPEQAAEFAERTGVDALAVAVGNVHGFTRDAGAARPRAAARDRRGLSGAARPARRVRAARRRTCAARSPPGS